MNDLLAHVSLEVDVVVVEKNEHSVEEAFQVSWVFQEERFTEDLIKRDVGSVSDSDENFLLVYETLKEDQVARHWLVFKNEVVALYVVSEQILIVKLLVIYPFEINAVENAHVDVGNEVFIIRAWEVHEQEISFVPFTDYFKVDINVSTTCNHYAV